MKKPTQSTGIKLGKNSKDNIVARNHVSGFKVGIDNDGERNEILDSRIQGPQVIPTVQLKWYEKPLWIAVFGAILSLVVVYIGYRLGWK